MVSVLAQLRAMRPPRRLSRVETRRVAELQAAKLLRLSDVDDVPVPTELIFDLPRLRIEYADLGRPSGLAHWQGGLWHIAVNACHARVRQRFSLAHELAHVVEAPFVRWAASHEQAEQAADAFAASLLMPKRSVVRLWAGGMQSASALARYCDVSRAAMDRRLLELGLVEPAPRCAYTAGGGGGEVYA